MIKLLKILLTVLVTSFFYFPFEFTFLQGVNTKMMEAALGLVLVAFALVRRREFTIPRELLILLFCSGMVSLFSLISISYNQTNDTTYATYIISASVWLSGAFTVCQVIKWVHHRIDVKLLSHYLIGACLFQCVMTMLIAFVPSVSQFVDTYIYTGQDLMKKLERLYGIGAVLDIAGSRFAAILVVIAFLLTASPKKISGMETVFYTFSFIVIAIIGNMIARTTTVGLLIGVAWFLASPFIVRRKQSRERSSGKAFIILAVTSAFVLISVMLYRTVPEMEELFRFGFEGFFAFVEEGKWTTGSTEILKDMVVWPEELRTWIIGDGYFLNSRHDPNYLGDATERGFYMGTDIGYLRFIFYFGVSGLIWIIAVVAYSAYVCGRYFKNYRWLFVLALSVGLTVWTKVSTDIFLFFALFLCAAALHDDPEENGLVPETAETR